MKKSAKDRPIVGVAVVVEKNGEILIGTDQRKGEALFGVPGGHWESDESLKEAALREVREESGISCKNVQLISVYDFYRDDRRKSYVTIGMKASMTLVNLETYKTRDV